MSGYYDATPQRIPHTPIVISGSASTKYGAVARIVGGLTSLPLLSVADLVVHESGKSAERILDEDGEEAWRAATLRATERGLASTPFGLVVVPPDVPAQKAVRKLTRKAVLVAVRRDFEDDDLDVQVALDEAVFSVGSDEPEHELARRIVDALRLTDDQGA